MHVNEPPYLEPTPRKKKKEKNLASWGHCPKKYGKEGQENFCLRQKNVMADEEGPFLEEPTPPPINFHDPYNVRGRETTCKECKLPRHQNFHHKQHNDKAKDGREFIIIGAQAQPFVNRGFFCGPI